MFPVKGVLAVDGGASKVDLALVDGDGRLLEAIRRPGDYNFGLGHNGALDSLAGAIARLGGGGLLATIGVFCVAGADVVVDDRRIAAEVEARRWTTRSIVRNDTFAVLRAGTDRKWGVAVVCGTGLNCAGLGPDGRSVRFASFGELSGDRAYGGGWLGRAALGATIRARDGRGPRTVLEETLPPHFGLSRPTAVMEAVYVGRLDYDRMSEVAPLVMRAAAAGDEVAAGLMGEVVDEIVVTANAAIRRLHLTRRDVHVVLGGGVIRGMDSRLLGRIEAGIKAVAPDAVILQLAAPPVLGAALIGLDEMRAPGAARRRVREALTHARLAGRSPRPTRARGRRPLR